MNKLQSEGLQRQPWPYDLFLWKRLPVGQIARLLLPNCSPYFVGFCMSKYYNEFKLSSWCKERALNSRSKQELSKAWWLRYLERVIMANRSGRRSTTSLAPSIRADSGEWLLEWSSWKKERIKMMLNGERSIGTIKAQTVSPSWSRRVTTILNEQTSVEQHTKERAKIVVCGAKVVREWRRHKWL